MEYRIHELKKKLQQRRIHISLCLFVVTLVVFMIWYFYPSQTTKTITKPNVPPVVEEEKPKGTLIISDFAILKTYERKGKQYFTQGLTFKDSNTLIESAGLYHQSVIHSLNIEDLTVIKESKLGDKYFGEGCEIIQRGEVKEIYQLTWREKKVFVWDLETLELQRELTLPLEIKEGWGITKTPKDEIIQSFFISDGSSNIYLVNPDNLEIIKTIQVKEENGSFQRDLNELEYINGKLWANIFGLAKIAVINPLTGIIEYYIDLSMLKELAREKAKEVGAPWNGNTVLNGIAYDSENDRLIITGKQWPLMWEIKVHHPSL